MNVIPAITIVAAAFFAQATPKDDEALQSAVRAAVEKAAPVIVRIETIGGLESGQNATFGQGPTTGLIVDAEGYVVSSAFNFAEKPDTILVRLADGSRKSAKFIAVDKARSLVLLKIESDKPLPVAEVAPQKELRVGQWTVAAGRTFDGEAPNISLGILSATDRVWGKALQTDAAVSPNNYGGPLLDLQGRVLGVLAPLSPDGNEAAGLEWYDSGVGFAVPLETILKKLPQWKKGKDLLPGVVGISMKSKNVFTEDSTLGPTRPQSPASAADIRAGDRVVQIDDRKITRSADVKEELGRRYAGDEMRITVARGEERLEKNISLVAKLPPYEFPYVGLLPMRDEEPREKADANTSGVTIRFVFANSPAAQAGLKPGDVLLSFNGQALKDRAATAGKLAERSPGDSVKLLVRSGPAEREVSLKLGALPNDPPPQSLPPSRKTLNDEASKQSPNAGMTKLKIAEFSNEASFYSPITYESAKPCGLVLWLHGTDGVKPDDLLKQWRGSCDSLGLILVAPKSSDGKKWTSSDRQYLPRLLAHFSAQFEIDPARTVVVADGAASQTALALAAQLRGMFQGLAILRAAPSKFTFENEPSRRLCFYVAASDKELLSKSNKKTLDDLKKEQVPLQVVKRNDASTPLADDEIEALAQWIDALDRL